MLLENFENNQQPKEGQYQIKLGISTQNFNQKPTPTEIRKIQFSKELFSIPEMVEKIKQGHCPDFLDLTPKLKKITQIPLL